MRLDPSKYLTDIYSNPNYATQILTELYASAEKLRDSDSVDAPRYAEFFQSSGDLVTLQDMPGYLLTQSALDVIEKISVTRKFDLSLLQSEKTRYYDFYINADLSCRVKWEPGVITALLAYRQKPGSTIVSTSVQYIRTDDPTFSMQGSGEEDFKYHQWVIRVLLFIELTEPDFLILPPNKKFSSRPIGYVNPTPSKLIIVTSKWNFHVIRTEGFGVSGHYRAQRCGEGHRKVKMTWIQPFQKHGYVRRAKTGE